MFHISGSYFVNFGFAKLLIFTPDQVGNFSGLLKIKQRALIRIDLQNKNTFYKQKQ